MPNIAIGVAAGAAVLTAVLTGCGERAPAVPPAVDVKAVTVLQRDVPVYIDAIGETRGSTEIEVRARVEGFLESVDYREGFPVTKGDLMYTIDPAPLEAAVARAEGLLAEADAGQARALQDVLRYKPLVEKNAISREDYETAVMVERAAQAQVKAARAAVTSAKLDLSYTRVLAPASGLAGKTEVYPGTLVGRDQSTLLTRISQIDTIHVRFTIPEQDYLYYARRAEQRQSQGDPGAGLPFEMILADGSVHREIGRLVFIDRNVDSATGSILAEAAFPNPGQMVRPGQFARVRVAVDVKTGALLVPQRAVTELQGRYNVAVVKPDNTIEIRSVTPSVRVGTLWVIDSGLEPGEVVVVDGLQKVRPGTVVKPEMIPAEDGAPAPDASPDAATQAQS